MKHAAVAALLALVVTTVGCSSSLDSKAEKFVETHATRFNVDEAGPEPDGVVGEFPGFGQQLAAAESIKAVPADEVAFVLADNDPMNVYSMMPEKARALIKADVILANEGEPGGERFIVVGARRRQVAPTHG